MSKISLAFVAACVLMTSVAEAQDTNAPLMIARQGSFFVGGHDVYSETLSTQPAFAPTGTITVEQMYVRYQVPVAAKRYPITFIHGCCLTGKTWETTPDGRMGWDEYFVRKGYAVYIVDQVSRGRSAGDPTVIVSAKMGRTPADQLPTVFSAAHETTWVNFRFGPEYQKAYPGLQFPIDAISEFWKQTLPDWASSLATPNPTVPALSALAIRLNGTILVSHSQSGIYPFQTASLDTRGIAGIISIEPSACPDPTGDVTPYTKMPIMILWGDYIDLSPRWSPRLAACKEFAQAVKKSGGAIENVVLPEVGRRGNSHMLMQDRNNLEIADWLLAWLDRSIQTIAPH